MEHEVGWSSLSFYKKTKRLQKYRACLRWVQKHQIIRNMWSLWEDPPSLMYWQLCLPLPSSTSSTLQKSLLISRFLKKLWQNLAHGVCCSSVSFYQSSKSLDTNFMLALSSKMLRFLKECGVCWTSLALY
jgi:hypothetical protein